LQIQSRYPEDNKNIIDLKKARNANEVIVVLSRINTTFSLLNSKFREQKLSKLTVTEGVDALRFCVDSLIDLRCAHSIAQEFNDIKRDRCFSMIEVQRHNIRQFQQFLIATIDKVCAPKADKHLLYLAEAAKKVLNKIGKTTQLHVKVPDQEMVCFRTKQGVVDANGYESGPITVKLRKKAGTYFISLPDSPFVMSEESPVDGAKAIVDYLKHNLTDFEYIGSPKVKESDDILALKPVQEVHVLDDRLEVVLKHSAQPADIKQVIQHLLLYIRRAISVANTDVIHRVNQYGDNKTVSFILAKRKVTDPKTLAKLAKLLNINKQDLDRMMK